ncbi:MAG: TIGR02452 family protein [Prevotellaceae bacterium]|jgi:uncharacterized protein (TIGR02452 family)|nr:TIGR02452 family protein [Prevotellaceae bacterium]
MENRNNRVQEAQQTLQIIKSGVYTAGNERVNIAESIKYSVKATVLYTPESFVNINSEATGEISARNIQTTISVKNCTSMEAATELLKTKERIGCLNFASAKNPGGGFLSGAQAQEESLARASSLYPTLTKFQEMYDYNRSRQTYLYSDYMIYSQDVVFFRNDAGKLLPQPYKMDILTSPAVNIGAMKQNNPKELSSAKDVMLKRIDKILSVFVLHKAANLVLGAYGCGVFQNDPKDVAQYFAEYLTKDGKYAHCFNNIVFAVFDRSRNQENIRAFEQVFNSRR